MKKMGGAIGYILGTVIVVPLGLYLISIIFYSPNKVTDSQINQYIKESKNITTPIIPPALVDEKIGLQIKRYRIYLNRNLSGDKTYFTYVFYYEPYKKYFSLLNLCENIWALNNIDDGRNLIITVNKQDLNNSIYGTKNNPVPVLMFVGQDKSIRYEQKDFNKAYMNEVYRENVKIYLKYIMPKEEFKERFK